MSRVTSLRGLITRAATRPHRLLPYFARAVRNFSLERRSTSFLDFYSRVVDATAKSGSPDFAIGSDSREHWQEIGSMQYEYLLRHGIQPHQQFLDIGCGNLRLGVHLIPYLEEGNYTGIDISADILTSAYRTLADHSLQHKRPYLFLLRTTDYAHLPTAFFDRVQAHSVFSHLPLAEIERVLREAWRVMRPGAIFDFTFFESQRPSTFLREDFTYPRATMLSLTRDCGFEAEVMPDWHYLQEKVRARKPLTN